MLLQQKQKKPKSKILRAAKYLAGGAAVAGAGVAGTRYLKSKKTKVPSPGISPNSSSSALTHSSSQAQGFSNKKFQNSQKVKQRLDALGGTAAGLNRKGRTANELNVIKNRQKTLGQKNAAKAKKLRGQGNYFKTRLKLTSFGRSIKLNFSRKRAKRARLNIRSPLQAAAVLGGASVLGLAVRDLYLPVTATAKTYWRNIRNR